MGTKFKYLRSIILFLSLTIPGLFFSQAGLVNYNQEDGLNTSRTYQITQDTKGFIWIGSDNGVFRFDGVSFKQYGRKEGIKNIDVLTPVSFADGSVFVFPFQGDFAWIKDEKIYTAENNAELAKLQMEFPTRLRLIHDPNKQCVGINAVINPKKIILFKNGKVALHPINIPVDGTYWVLDYDFKDKLLIYLMNSKRAPGFYHFYRKSGKLELLKSEPDIPGFANLWSSDRYIVTYQDNRFEIIDKLDFSIRKISTKSTIIGGNFISRNLLFVLPDSGGVLCYDLFKDPNMEKPALLMENYIVHDMLMDNDQNVWFSTKNSGIFFLSKHLFNSYLEEPIRNNSGYISTICGNQNQILLGYEDGKINLFYHKQLYPIPFFPSARQDIRAIYMGENKAIIGLSRLLLELDLKTMQTKPVKEYAVKNVIPFSKQQVLVCTDKALLSYHIETGKRQVLLYQKTYSALLYSEDSLFVGSFKNLYKFNLKTQKKKLFLSGVYLNNIYAFGKNTFLGATNGNGVILFNRDKILATISEDKGLAGSKVRSILVQDKHTFWVSTNTGLSRIFIRNRDTLISNFGRIDGLPSDNVSGCFLRNDTLFVGTSKGIALLALKNLLERSRYQKKVLVNSVMINGKDYLAGNPVITSSYPDNSLTINLSFPDYTSQGNVSYLYRIEGLNNNWLTSNSSRIILNSIPPGEYNLRVYGIRYNGQRTLYPTTLPIIISPVYWQTWWFKGLTGLFILVSGFGLFFYLFQRRRAKKMMELVYNQKIAELELQAVKAQMNPHFVYNCLNSIKFLLYKKDYPETESYLNVFTQMIRRTLHYSENTFVSIQEEITYLTLYLEMEQLRFKNQFQFQVNYSGEVDQNWMIPSLLIQPFVENAIKHGIGNIPDGKGKITIDFDSDGTQLCIRIFDNGSGFDLSELALKTDSFGIKLTQKRMETFHQLFNTEITWEISSETTLPNAGTEIKLYISL